MALKFHDGFDAAHNTTGQSASTYLNRMGYSGTTSCTTQTGRNGSGLSLFNTSPVTPLAAALSSIIVGLGYRLDGLGATRIVALKSGTTFQLTVSTDATGAVYLKRGTESGTTLASAPAGTITAGAWNYFELKATIDSTAGSYELRMNGATLFSGSGVNTQAQAVATCDGVNWTNLSAYLDDIYICDTTGSSPQNDFLGPVQSLALMPTADGTTHAWTPSTGTDGFEMINEKPANDDTDYVSAASTGLVELCSAQTVGSTDVILGVTQRALVRKTDAGVAQLKTTLRIGSTNYDGDTQAIGDSYAYVSQLYQDSPATSAQWTATEVNGAQLVGFTSA